MVAVDWSSLMTRSRFNPNPIEIPTVQDRHEEYRRSFQKDYDRVIFSSAFRRLQGKTQVHPFPKYDYTRVRLTHSLEVASVARTLGRAAGHVIYRHDRDAPGRYARASASANGVFLRGEFDDHPLIFIEDVATLVATAALAHDIGNPPFGHAGEHAIRDWFSHRFASDDLGLTEAERRDFVHYEGNALGFRTLTHLQAWRERGGLRITNSVLAASVKYPHTSDVIDRPPQGREGEREFRKFNVFQADVEAFSHVAEACGLRRIETGENVGGRSLAHSRHPFAYLVEAADDICYLVTDIEDGGKANILPKRDAMDLLRSLCAGVDGKKLDSLGDDDDRISYLRAAAIGRLVDAVARAFAEHVDEIVSGAFSGDLLSASALGGRTATIRHECETRLYRGRDKMIAESASAAVIFRLLDALVPAALEHVGGRTPSEIGSRRFGVMPESFVRGIETPYDAALAVTDYIGGMTDKYAFHLSRELCGIEFPPS